MGVYKNGLESQHIGSIPLQTIRIRPAFCSS